MATTTIAAAGSVPFQRPLDHFEGGTNCVALAGGCVRRGGGGALIVRSGGRGSRIVGAGGAVGSRTTGAGAADAGLCVLFVSSFRHSAIVCGRSFSVKASA